MQTMATMAKEHINNDKEEEKRMKEREERDDGLRKYPEE